VRVRCAPCTSPYPPVAAPVQGLWRVGLPSPPASIEAGSGLLPLPPLGLTSGGWCALAAALARSVKSWLMRLSAGLPVFDQLNPPPRRGPCRSEPVGEAGSICYFGMGGLRLGDGRRRSP
jgi:hypothetical protein